MCAVSRGHASSGWRQTSGSSSVCGVPDMGMETASGGPRAGRGSELVGFSPAPMFLLRDSPHRPSPPPVRAPWQPPLRIPVKERLTFQAAGGPGASVFQLICSRDGGGDSGGRAQSSHALSPAAARGDLAGDGHSGREHGPGSSRHAPHWCPHTPLVKGALSQPRVSGNRTDPGGE